MKCEHCGKEFKPAASNQRFCSASCRNKHLAANRETGCCRWCGKELTGGTFCDETCKREYMEYLAAGRMSYTRKCRQCGVTFYTNNMERQFCTPRCEVAFKVCRARANETREQRLNRLAREARECGLDYGTYRAMLGLGKTYEELRAREIERSVNRVGDED